MFPIVANSYADKLLSFQKAVENIKYRVLVVILMFDLFINLYVPFCECFRKHIFEIFLRVYQV